MLKVAMIGAGGYAYQLIKRIWMLPEKYELVAVSSNPNRNSTGKIACRNKGIDIYSDVDALLDAVQGKADVIFVPTPIHTHRPLAIKCMDAGFDVFLEKPPVATIQELDELIEYSSSRNKRVAVMFHLHYTKIISEMNKRIASEEFGEVKRVRGVAAWPRMDDYYDRNGWAGKVRLNGDWILDGTVNNPLAHMLSNELYLASMEEDKMAHPKTVAAELYHGHDIESEDTSSLRIITDKDVEIMFNATLCPETTLDPIIVVECEKATLEYINFNETKISFKDGNEETILDETEQRVYMLEELYKSYINGEAFSCSLATCRPFTIAVNTAFESSGKVHEIDNKYITRIEQGDTIKTIINNIDELLQRAHVSGKLFSELGVEWAVCPRQFNCHNYTMFPTNNFVIG